MEKKIAVVTGASSGIGRCTAVALRDMGCKVYNLSRRDIPIENVKHIKTDITVEIEVFSAVDKIISTRGKLIFLSTVQASASRVLWNSQPQMKQRVSLRSIFSVPLR